MADTCIFCGKEIKFWQAGQLTCGGVPQPACGKCGDEYMGLPHHQRARLALETGRARSPEKIQEYLDAREAKFALEARRRARQEEALICCGQRMAKVDKVNLTSRVGFIQDYTGEMVMFRCGLCGQVKFFDASFLEYTPSEEEVTLPSQVPEHVAFKSGKKPPWEK